MTGRSEFTVSACLVIVTSITAAMASDTPSPITHCAKIQNAKLRLACYDDTAKPPPVPSKAPTLLKGAWSVTEETSKFDDSTNVIMQVDSLDTFQDRVGDTKSAKLIIACREKKTDVFFNFGGTFMADVGGYGDLTYRIDKTAAHTIHFNESTDHSSLGLWDGDGLWFIHSLLFGGEKLLLKATPFDQNAITVSFNISGTENAIAPLRKACGW